MPAEPNHAITCWPSVTGDAEQYGFVWCVGSFSVYTVPTCHSNSPSARSRHISVRRCSFSMAWVMKMRSPQTMGVEFPRSGSFTFQAMFSVSLHASGRSDSPETPIFSGPRQLGQFSATATPPTNHAHMAANTSPRSTARSTTVFSLTSFGNCETADTVVGRIPSARDALDTFCAMVP